MIPNSESLTVEFKSDRKRLSDAELVEVLVCLANTEGGEPWLGVEDDGQVTGLNVDHMGRTGLDGMVAADPTSVTSSDYPNENCPVLKTGDLREFGEYRTQRYVSAQWDKLETGVNESC